jgi:hypothetical protein
MKVKKNFNGPLIGDIDPNLQPANAIEDALNMPIVSNSNIQQSRNAAEGTLPAYENGSLKISAGYEPIMFVSYLNKLIICSTNHRPGISSGNGGHGEIGIATINQDTGFISSYESLYNSQDLKWSIKNMIKGMFYFENSRTGRLYITDNNVPPKAFNIFNPVYSTNIASGSLIPGRRYMVVYGDITHGIASYGTHFSSTDFVASSAAYTQIGTVVPKVIEYVAPEILDWVPVVKLGTIDFLTYIPGDLYSGSYEIFYQLVTDDGGSSGWYSIAGMNTPAIGIGINPTSGNVNWGQYQGGLLSEQTNKGLRFKIEEIDTNYQKIRVAAVRYISAIAKEVPFIFFEGAVTGTSMEVDLVTNQGEFVQFGELITIGLNLKTVRDFGFEDNLNLPANITAEKDYGTDNSNMTAKCVEYLFPGDSRGHIGDATGDDHNTSNIHGTDYAPSSGVSYIYAFQWYKVKSGSITYDGNVYNPGDVFQGIASDTSFTGAGVVVPVIRIKKYGSVYKEIEILSDYMDNKGMAMNKYMKSKWRDETYRYGTLLWSTQGNPMFVRWGLDKKIIPTKAISTDIDPDNGQPYGFEGSLAIPRDLNTDEWYLRHVGVEFDGIDFSGIASELGIPITDLGKYFSGFSIVRAPRDKEIIGEGLWCMTVQESDPWTRGGDGTTLQDSTQLLDAIKVYPEILPVTNQTNPNQTVQRKNFIYAWYSPDQLLDDGGKFNPEQGDEIKITEYLSEFGPYDSGVPGRDHFYLTDIAPSTSHFAAYSKMYQSNDESAVSNNFVIGGINYPCVPTPKGTSQLIPDIQYARPFNADPNTFESFPAPSEVYSFSLYRAAPANKGVANKGMIVLTGNSEGQLSSPSDYRLGFGYFTMQLGEIESQYSDGTLPGRRPMRPLVSWVRRKGNLYGGNTEQAKANTPYIFTGHFQAFDSAFLTYLNGNSGIADGIQVFGGDTFVNFFDFTQSKHYQEQSIASGVIFPCQSTINTNLRRGRTFTKDWSYLPGVNDNGVSFLNPQQPEDFLYNYGYSGEDIEQTFPALPVNYQNINEFRYRALYSKIKISGEGIDNFRKFPVGQYLDVTGSFGPIANVRTAAGRLYYWQEDGCVGYITITERQTITGQSGTPTILGTTGVMSFYEEIEKMFGSQHTFGISDTPDGWAWIDARHRTMLFMPVNGKPQEISSGKAYINNFFNAISGELNKGDSTSFKKGIYAYFDRRRRESIFVLKSSQQSSYRAISFDWLNKNISTRYSFLAPLYGDNGIHGYCSYSGIENTIQPNTTYLIGESLVAVIDNVTYPETSVYDIYVCIESFSTLGIPVSPELDPVHWKKVQSSNDIELMFRGPICKFHGVVYENNIQFILNDQNETDKFLDHCEIVGNRFFFTSLRVEDPNTEFGLDADINSLINKEYEYRDTKWYFNIPLNNRTKAYLVGTWFRLFFRRKNYVTDPTVSDNSPVKIVSLISEIRDAQ